ncbi:LPXTG cell wall anchor domain-containing protein [Asanoa siamensis]|uniref:Gram-positive cocci surface proteins LPxTG domain-containing protein n=1 Tax=Asanoa siamensis TaxID=926357 RepID=A0ABQ4CJR5_9ACTN|nr:LPXTG cell wall anchor domain-containing protein [Asanoa siamensis]GIF71540.1 hypothetical protein Asi02nite_10580 [Asanoa siamensis]
MRFRGLACVVACAVAVFCAPGAARAHPFGDPQTVAIEGDPARPEVVRVRWKVGGLDDLTTLGVALGVLPEDRVLLDGAVFYQDSDAAAVGSSPRFADYLLEQITVRSDGDECAGTVANPRDLARAGAAIDYDCRAPANQVTVAVRTLTDLNPAYKTLATGPGGARAVYTSDAPSHDWSLDGPAPKTGSSAAGQIGAVVGGVLLVAGTVTLVLRRRRKTA